MRGSQRWWGWPEGFAYRPAFALGRRSRQRRHEFFLAAVRPQPQETILDVGGTASTLPHMNMLEASYPFRDRITVVGLEDVSVLVDVFPGVHTEVADGRELPFPDSSYDIVYSNAVIEHVGGAAEQVRFVREAVRVARRAVFIATPDRRFPLDGHTLVPLAHWLPPHARNTVYRRLGREYWSEPGRLQLLTERGLRGVAEAAGVASPRVHRQRVAGLSSNLILIVSSVAH
jgi:hypothetical protein